MGHGEKWGSLDGMWGGVGLQGGYGGHEDIDTGASVLEPGRKELGVGWVLAFRVCLYF